MSDLSQILIGLPLLRAVRPEPIQATATMWERRVIPAGQLLWSQRSGGDHLGILLAGELVSMMDDQEVGRVLQGELVGEAGAFQEGSRRITTLLAWSEAEVLLISSENLRKLGERGHPVYDALLSEAITHLARRVRTTDQEIARLSKGSTDAPERAEVSTLVRLWRRLVPGGPEGPCPPIQPLLQRRATLKDVPFEVVRQIARAFTAVALPQGEVVFLEGEQGGSAFLVASGEVEVLRHVRGQKATRLALLRAGDLFGVNTLVTRGARTASCVTTAPTWIYRIDADAVDALPADARRAWQESMLASLAAQLRNANDLLRRVRPLRVAFDSPDNTTTELDMDGPAVEPLTSEEPLSEELETLETNEIEPVEHLSEEEIRRVMQDGEEDGLVPPEEDEFRAPPELTGEVPDEASREVGAAPDAAGEPPGGEQVDEPKDEPVH